MADDFKYDVFLSHNARDKARVRRLAERWRASNLRVSFDEWVIKPGYGRSPVGRERIAEGRLRDRELAIEREPEAARVQACPAVASQRRRMLCLSPAALGSDWVGLEPINVLSLDPSNTGRRFILFHKPTTSPFRRMHD